MTGPPPARSGRTLVWAGAAGLLLVGGVAWEILRSASAPPAAEPAPITRRAAASSPAPVAAPGRLQIYATPWARVVSIVDVATSRPLPLADGTETPCVLESVAPGTYRVLLSCPPAGQKSVERTVTVAPGGTALLSEAFLSTAALVDSLR